MDPYDFLSGAIGCTLVLIGYWALRWSLWALSDNPKPDHDPDTAREAAAFRCLVRHQATIYVWPDRGQLRVSLASPEGLQREYWHRSTETLLDVEDQEEAVLRVVDQILRDRRNKTRGS
jgi:hypothetical protein